MVYVRPLPRSPHAVPPRIALQPTNGRDYSFNDLHPTP